VWQVLNKWLSMSGESGQWLYVSATIISVAQKREKAEKSCVDLRERNEMTSIQLHGLAVAAA